MMKKNITLILLSLMASIFFYSCSSTKKDSIEMGKYLSASTNSQFKLWCYIEKNYVTNTEHAKQRELLFNSDTAKTEEYFKYMSTKRLDFNKKYNCLYNFLQEKKYQLTDILSSKTPKGNELIDNIQKNSAKWVYFGIDEYYVINMYIDDNMTNNEGFPIRNDYSTGNGGSFVNISDGNPSLIDQYDYYHKLYVDNDIADVKFEKLSEYKKFCQEHIDVVEMQEYDHDTYETYNVIYKVSAGNEDYFVLIKDLMAQYKNNKKKDLIGCSYNRNVEVALTIESLPSYNDFQN